MRFSLLLSLVLLLVDLFRVVFFSPGQRSCPSALWYFWNWIYNDKSYTRALAHTIFICTRMLHHFTLFFLFSSLVNLYKHNTHTSTDLHRSTIIHFITVISTDSSLRHSVLSLRSLSPFTRNRIQRSCVHERESGRKKSRKFSPHHENVFFLLPLNSAWKWWKSRNDSHRGKLEIKYTADGKIQRN